MPNYLPMPPYAGFTAYTPTIPKFYWDVYSQEERIKTLCMEVMKVIAYCDANVDATNAIAEDVETLKALFAEFQASGFDDYYREQVTTWIDEHTPFIFEHVAKQVYFNITDDGYFCAYVPDGWGDIVFDTGAVYGTPEYGHLILSFEAERL